MSEKEHTLRECAKSGNLDCLKELIAEGVNVNAADPQGFTALFVASYYLPHVPDKDYLGVVKLLVEAGADINATLDNGQTPLYDAAVEGLYDVVEYLHKQGAAIDVALSNGWTPLHEIGTKQEQRIFNFTVTLTQEDGQKVTLTDPDAIREAIGSHPDDEYAAYVRTAQYLIDNGADVNAVKTELRQTPLFDNACFGAAEIVALIVGVDGVDLNHRDKWGLTALHFACRNGHLETVKVLLAAGADVNAQENYGFTPLHEAAENGYVEVAKYLVKQGADPNLGLNKAYDPYEAGDTPLAIAEKKGNKAVVDYLKTVINNGK